MADSPHHHPDAPTDAAASAGSGARPDAGGEDRQRVLIESARAQVARIRSSSGVGSGAGGAGAAVSHVIPGYEIVREIHRGAQGVVYQAVQRATQRHVAVKVMREGPFAGEAERVRFDREVQVLAQLDHPGIVTIHDSGSASGSHYFVMDFIRGQPLDAYIAAARPPLRERLTLFAEICEAVNAAHLRGIIHRDLKPGNIRVDQDGRPHILDFGLAKSAWGTVGGSDPQFTETGQFVGSLPWASPEQAEGTPGRIDLRTDVYSLGVILYQMLTGRFPYTVTGPVREVLERIVHEEPARPSSAAEGEERALRFGDEVDTIALKCLSKEPERRYQSARELARDVRRFLAGEPIDAKRESVAYVLRKQLRRHRAAVAVGAGFVVLLSAGMVTSLVLWRSAEVHRREAESNLIKAQAAEAEARIQAERSEKVTSLVTDAFRATDPSIGGDHQITAREALDRGAERTLSRLRDDPLLQASFLSALGIIYGNLGENDRAIEMLSRALEARQKHMPPGSRPIADTATSLGVVQMQAGDQAGAERSFTIAYEMLSRRLGPQDWHVVQSLVRCKMARGDLASAEPILREAAKALRDSGGPAYARLSANNYLGQLLMEQRRYGEAIGVMREALVAASAIGPHLADATPAVKNNLALLLLETGELAEARQLAEDGLAVRQKALPPEHLEIASSMYVLGAIRARSGDAAGAEPLARESLRMREAQLPATDERVIESRKLVEEIDRVLAGGN